MMEINVEKRIGWEELFLLFNIDNYHKLNLS